MTTDAGVGQRSTWIATWIAVALGVVGFLSAAWIRQGALEQRVTNLEIQNASQAQQISAMRQNYDDGIGSIRSDVAYIRGRVDYLSTAVTDIRQRR